MTEKNKNAIPQFVTCGLEMGNCKRQIPYDMAEHERIIMTELLDKVMQKQRTIIDDDGVMYRVVFLKDIEEMKAEVQNEKS